ncbi:MAG: hypothetical protein LH624_19505 [Cryobacterium sp.]|nr:hypothetical protein [Cryobacterium sp.]
MAHALSTGSGVVLDLIRSGRATTRTDLIEQLGWSRVTLARRLDELLHASIVMSVGQLDSRGGRPPEEFAVNPDAGLLLAVDIGGSHTRLAITDLVSTILSEDEADIGLSEGPAEIFDWAGQVFDHMLDRLGKARGDVVGIGVGVPGPRGLGGSRAKGDPPAGQQHPDDIAEERPDAHVGRSKPRGGADRIWFFAQTLPHEGLRWYRMRMSGTESMRVGDRGRVVLPAGIRERRNWSEGTTLIAIETDRGVILTARDELERIVREQLAGTDVVAALLAERRAASLREDDA